MTALGMPQHRFASIHVVGTNGKSSVTRMVAALLEAHGVAAGACAVQVGTATFNDPSAPRRVLDELEAEVARHGFGRVADVVGIAHERTVHR